MNEGDTLLNAAIGAVATIFLSGFVPMSPLFGGAIAGYLEGGEQRDGLVVGAISGVFALIPMLVVMFVIANVFFVAAVSIPEPGALIGGGLAYLFVLLVVIFGAIYSVGLSAAGGYLGHYVKYETDFDL